MQAAPVQTEIEMTGGFSLGVGEGDYLPIVKVAPIYPQRALSRGIQGFCVVQYTVTRQGTIRDPFVVEDQCTSTLFHRASVQAASNRPPKTSGTPGSEGITVPTRPPTIISTARIHQMMVQSISKLWRRRPGN